MLPVSSSTNQSEYNSDPNWCSWTLQSDFLAKWNVLSGEDFQNGNCYLYWVSHSELWSLENYLHSVRWTNTDEHSNVFQNLETNQMEVSVMLDMWSNLRAAINHDTDRPFYAWAYSVQRSIGRVVQRVIFLVHIESLQDSWHPAHTYLRSCIWQVSMLCDISPSTLRHNWQKFLEVLNLE